MNKKWNAKRDAEVKKANQSPTGYMQDVDFPESDFIDLPEVSYARGAIRSKKHPERLVGLAPICSLFTIKNNKANLEQFGDEQEAIRWLNGEPLENFEYAKKRLDRKKSKESS